MTAKEYLSQIRKINILIEEKEYELEEIRNKMEGIPSISLDSDGSVKCTHNIMSPQDKWIYKYMDYQKEINNSKKELIDLKSKISNEINSLNNPDYISLLYKRYFRFKKWEQIAIEMHMSYRQVLRIHGQALKCMGEKLNLIN